LFSVYGDLRCGDPVKFNSALNATCYNSGGVASTKYIVPFYYQYNTVDCASSRLASKQNVTSCVKSTTEGTSSDTRLILGDCKSLSCCFSSVIYLLSHIYVSFSFLHIRDSFFLRSFL
jgi:hypothetical protein